MDKKYEGFRDDVVVQMKLDDIIVLLKEVILWLVKKGNG